MWCRNLKELVTLSATHGSTNPFDTQSGDSRSSSPALNVSTRSSAKSACVNFTTKLLSKLRIEAKEKEKEDRKQQIAQREKDKEMYKEVTSAFWCLTLTSH